MRPRVLVIEHVMGEAVELDVAVEFYPSVPHPGLDETQDHAAMLWLLDGRVRSNRAEEAMA
jgi:hypothetical protein